MKWIKNLALSIVFLSFFLGFFVSSATPAKHFSQTDVKEYKRIRSRILNQLPGLNGIIKKDKKGSPVYGAVSGTKKTANFDVKSLKEKLKKNTGNIKLFINVSKDVNTISDELKNYGVRIIKTRNNTVAVEVPIENLEKLLSDVESIENARLPLKFYPQAVESEGVAITDSNDFHDFGFYGAGVKIAVLDVGFKGLQEAQQNGDLPANVETHDYTGNGLEKEYYHGTACAEILYDIAPQAELHLIKINTDADIIEALNYCVNNGIDIISVSLGTYGTGPGDGTGPLDEAFDDIRAEGILVVAGAGNQGYTTSIDGVTLGRHWKGAFRDIDGDNVHDFQAGDDDVYFNLFAAYPDTDDDGESETGEVSVLLRSSVPSVNNSSRSSVGDR